MSMIMPNGSYTVNKPFAQPFGAPAGSTPSKPGPGRPSAPMQPQGVAPSTPAVPMTQYGQPGGMTPSKPGPAQPSVPMMQNYAPGQAKPQQSPYATSTPYGGQAGGQQAPGYGSPQGQRGQMRTADFRDRDGDRVDDRDQDGAGMPAYGRPSQPQDWGMGLPPGAQVQMPLRGWGQPPLTQYYAGSSPSGQPPSPQPSLTQYTAPGNPLPGPTSRPAPFQSTTRNFDGTTSEMPNFQQRDAFISQINNQLGEMQNQSWQQPGMGAPQFNFPQMWGQAGEMVQQGFQNPFAQQPDGGNQIRQLLGGQQGRMMSQDAWSQMNPGSPYPSAPPGLPQGAVARGASGDIIPSAIGIPLTGLPPGMIADGPPTAQPGGSINQGSAPRGSAVPAFTRPVLKAPGSPGDPSPPPTGPPAPATPARPTAPRPPAAPTSGSNSFSIERLAADPNLTPSQKAAKFLEANRESIKNGTFRHADIDALGLPSTDARLLKNKVNTQTLSFDRLRKAKEVSKMFPNYGIPQSAYAAFAKKYG